MKIAIALVLMTGLAAADDAKLRQHISAAREHHAQQRYAEALAELEAAYAIEPKPSLLFALGQVHVQLGRCDRAVVFYRLFLASRPKPEDAAVANEAIEACKTEAPVEVPLATALPPAPVVVLPTPVPRPERHVESHRRARYVGAGLVIAGVGVAVGSGLLYRAGSADRDRADAATTYDVYEQLTDRARSRYTATIVTGVIAAGAIATGAIVFATHREDTIRFTPTGDGGAISWGRRF